MQLVIFVAGFLKGLDRGYMIIIINKHLKILLLVSCDGSAHNFAVYIGSYRLH